MDPNSVDSSLQKTSPELDPAAVYRLSTEVSAQASMLVAHQQQLARLPSLTEELVTTLQAFRLSPSESAPPPPPVDPAPQAPPPSHSMASPRLAYPEKFDGTPAKCKGFLLQCSLFVSQQPVLYPTEESRIAFLCSLLTDKALDWVTAVWNFNRPAFTSFESFLQRFRAVFDLPEGGDGAGEQILTLKQGRNTAAEFALAFRTLAAQTGWPDDPLKLHFRRGLSLELQTELACRDEGKTLDQLIDLAIRIDNMIRSRRPSRGSTYHSPSPPVVPEQEAMQVGHARISPEERDRRYRQNLCLYCGQAGHVKVSCPTRPKQHASSAVSQSLNSSKCVKVPVKLAVGDCVIETMALIDSGAAGNFIDADFAKMYDLPLIPCKSPLAVAALDGKPLGAGQVQHTTSDICLTTGVLHSEIIRFFIIQAPNNPVVLGLPWLQLHEPQISWTKGQITHWSTKCFTQCLQTLKPSSIEAATVKMDPLHSTNILSDYADLAEAFSKAKATQLPPHRSSDCAIELLPGNWVHENLHRGGTS